MQLDATSVLRRCVILTWLVLMAVIIGLVLASRLTPLVDHHLVVIRGGSMEPTIPLGSLVIVRAGPIDQIRPGDVVTLRLNGDALVTHRVVRVAELADGRYLETKGDANGDPDPVLVPAQSVLGIVTTTVPKAGFLVAFLTIPTGMISAISLLTSLLLTAVLLEEPGPTRRGRPVVATTNLRKSGI